jgi:hypothetical protein
VRPLRSGTSALLAAVSAVALLTACGKAGSPGAHAGAQLPTVSTLAEADQQLHDYLQDVVPIGGRDTGTRTGSLLPDTLNPTTCPNEGQATHVVAETVSGARKGYATDVVGTLRHRGWHILGWNKDTPDGSQVTGSVQAGYHLSIQQKDDIVSVAIQTPCLQGAPLPRPSDFPRETTGTHDA